MAEIDYAFLADYAKVNPTGSLTAVGASWHFLQVPALPTKHRLSIAGRVRGKVGDEAVAIEFRIQGPNDGFTISLGGELMAPPNAGYGDGKVGLLFAVDIDVPLPTTGLYQVTVVLPDADVRRRLAFEVVLPPVALP
ncbi:hypothetical protein K8Z61_14170 [Nocardioides sp. TRM66260-LWL]|uniref:hypothetical protein n=1 Tax=Nocardioides sp. TRM66260-LWL TaxID=2874478 RepID=UPI001CC43A7D|nr:hypothetical protein [Nocardioides sp. TRM66260-LWL]MBZ5735637.1 hypothetical protein [Nocardioides sp. TRM66260-LWL]